MFGWVLFGNTNIGQSPTDAVYKESASTPLNIVFDGSMKTTAGVSLNDHLLVGRLSILHLMMFSFNSENIPMCLPLMFQKCTMLSP